MSEVPGVREGGDWGASGGGALCRRTDARVAGRPLVLLVVIVLGACGTNSVRQSGTEAAAAAAADGEQVIWEEDRACERTFAPRPVTGVVTIGRARAVEVEIQVDATRGVVTEAVLLGERSDGTAELDAALIEAALRLRFDCERRGMARGRWVYYI